MTTGHLKLSLAVRRVTFAPLQNAQLPALKHFIVYIGVENYGFDASLIS